MGFRATSVKFGCADWAMTCSEFTAWHHWSGMLGLGLVLLIFFLWLRV